MKNADVEQTMKWLAPEMVTAVRSMCEGNFLSHSFSMHHRTREDVVPQWCLILIVPHELSPRILDALRPIFDEHFGPGYLVDK